MSCKFNGKISAEFNPPKNWKLEKGLSFTVSGHGITDEDIALFEEMGANIASTGRITCKKGFVTDLASTPRILWNLIAPWDVARAAIIHDHLYAVLRVWYEGKNDMKKWKKGRALADKIFKLGMLAAEPSVPKWKIYPAYWAVRLFGRGPASHG